MPTKDTLTRKIETDCNGLTAKITLECDSEFRLREVYKKTVQLIEWIEKPDQTELDFQSAALLTGCTIRVDQPGKNAEAFSLVVEGNNAKSKVKELGELFNRMQKGETFNVKFEPIPTPKEKAAGTAAASSDAFKAMATDIKKLLKTKFVSTILQSEAEKWLDDKKADLGLGDDLRYRLNECEDKPEKKRAASKSNPLSVV